LFSGRLSFDQARALFNISLKGTEASLLLVPQNGRHLYSKRAVQCSHLRGRKQTFTACVNTRQLFDRIYGIMAKERFWLPTDITKICAQDSNYYPGAASPD
jgi:hypothetical protein